MYFFSTDFGTNLGSHVGALAEAERIAARIARDYGPITIYNYGGEVVTVVRP